MNKIDLSYLTPPGSGVYTVHTASEKKEVLWKKLYGSSENISKSWEDSLKKTDQNKTFLLGICSDNGGGILRGANWGPLFLRLSFLDHCDFPDFFDLGDIKVIPHLLHDKYLNKETIKNCQKELYGDKADNNMPVSPLSIAQKVAKDFYFANPTKNLFSLGGDHSISYPLVKAYLEHRKSINKKAALIHFDAHTDLLDQRLGIDLCFGSWVSHILDDLMEDELVIQLGIRSTGKDRSHWEQTKGVLQYWADEINQSDITTIGNSIIQHLKNKKVDELYISVDIDALDETYAAATGTPEKGGLSPDQIVNLISLLGEHFPITSGDLVEVAPFTRPANHINPEPDSTLLSASLIAKELINQMNHS